MRKPCIFSWFALCAGTALVQYLAVRLGLVMGIAHGNVSPVWPATGFAIAVLLRCGINLWPGVAVGSFLGLLQTGVGIAVAGGEALAALMEALIAYWLVRRWIGENNPFSRPTDVIRFCIAAGGAATAVSATMGVVSLCLGGAADWDSFYYLWGTWWLGDVMGALIVAPFLLIWTDRGPGKFGRHIWIRTGPIFGFLIFAGILAFWGPFVSTSGVVDYPAAFLTLPLAVAAAFLSGPRGATAACIVCSILAISGTIQGLGPFFRGSVNESVLLLQSYLVVISVTAALLAAVLNERDSALKEVRQIQKDLESRIERCTLEYAEANIKLQLEAEERRHAEKALRESEERYRNFFATSRDGIFMTTVQGEIFDVNPAALEMLGYGSDERATILSRAVTDFYAHPEDRAKHVEVVSKSGFSLEFPVDFITKDGKILHTLVTTVPRHDENGDVVGFQGTIRDVTERKRAEETLRKTVQRFHKILSSLYSGVLIVTEHGTVEFVNQAFCDMFDLAESPDDLNGITAQKMIEKILSAYSDPAAALNRIREVVSKRRPIKGEEIAMRDGRTYTVDFIPIMVDEKWCGRLWHHTDITDRKQADEERAKLVVSLTEALNQVKKLSGFLPICSSCKKIRDDKGYWRQVEEYIRAHSEAEFSHSICPECAEKLYPDYYKNEEQP